MNILILSPFFPYPLSQGGKIRVFNIIKHLSKLGHNITLACLSDRSVPDPGPLREFCREIRVISRRSSSAIDLTASLLGSLPYNCRRFWSNDFVKALKELTARITFDLVQIEFSLMWPYSEVFRGMPVTLDAHNIEWEIVKQIGNESGSFLKKLLYAREEKKLRDTEKTAWRNASISFAVSDRERDVIASVAGNEKVCTVSNGVDPERFTFAQKKIMGKRILFIGGLEYSPNLDSALFLVNEIFPLTKTGLADIKLDIVGRQLGRLGESVNKPDISLHEDVPDILPFMREADLLAVPLRQGAGTRIKILEAMAAGLPVVTTSKGCEGIDVINREHLMIADTPSGFAQSVEEVLADTDLRVSLTENARKLIESGYSWEKLVKKMENSYAAISN